jgi:hypothetical protein
MSDARPNDRTLREMQSSLPWTGHYHRDFRASPMTHKDFGHALLHVMKAGGKLAALLDQAEHEGVDWANAGQRRETAKLVADFVICALRMSNTCPDGAIDLQRAVEDRLTAKNNQLAAEAPALRDTERGISVPAHKQTLAQACRAQTQALRELVQSAIASGDQAAISRATLAVLDALDKRDAREEQK